MFRRFEFVILALGITAALLGACVINADRSGDGPPAVAPSDTDSVESLSDMSFSPSTVEIKAGETVAWVWDDGDVTHDVVFNDGPASPQQNDGTWERRFEHPGTYDYACTIHPGMTGLVMVT